MKTDYSLTMRQGGPDQADDECDIEYRAAHEKRTIAENVPDWLAREICAAPDLLDALNDLIRWDEDPLASGNDKYFAMTAKARAAIAKAKGPR